MKKLEDLLKNVSHRAVGDISGLEISNIRYDSRKVQSGDLFVALRGVTSDGHEYIDAAVNRGARAIVCESERRRSDFTVPCITTHSSRKALALMAAAYYGQPAEQMRLIGITGTNGKTSTAYLIESILRACGLRTGLLGTITYRIGDEEQTAPWTTPESLELHSLLSQMRDSKTSHAVMEVSSHALEQYRVEGLSFRAAVFTNLSQDHLDYHGTMEKYRDAKQKLFRQLDPVSGSNIINADDSAGAGMASQNLRKVTAFSAHKGKADVFPLSAAFSGKGISAELESPTGIVRIESELVGTHNLYNILAAVSTGICLDIPNSEIESGINSMQCVPGRLEPVNAGQDFVVLVDYAHTHDAMEKVITAVRPMVSGRLIVLFGCGGDRDKAKRPLMGQVAEKRADLVFLTSDNPRTEDPESIIRDVQAGISETEKFTIKVDRTEAIHAALDAAKKDDWVLILGKGHETYQVLGHERIDYDDREIARNYLT